MSDKKKFPRAVAAAVFEELAAALSGHCEPGFILAAGSFRRQKPEVGDLEILYVPKTGLAKTGGLFDEPANLADLAIEKMERAGVLARRTNVNGSEMFGEKNKLMVHVVTGLPVDLFATMPESWFNYLVCRTGGAESNMQVATAAKRQGFRWNPYGAGFTRLSDEHVFPMASERAVFEFVGLQYLEPQFRK